MYCLLQLHPPNNSVWNRKRLTVKIIFLCSLVFCSTGSGRFATISSRLQFPAKFSNFTLNMSLSGIMNAICPCRNDGMTLLFMCFFFLALFFVQLSRFNLNRDIILAFLLFFCLFFGVRWINVLSLYNFITLETWRADS